LVKNIFEDCDLGKQKALRPPEKNESGAYLGGRGIKAIICGLNASEHDEALAATRRK